MNEFDRNKTVEDYLRVLSRELGDVSPESGQELLEDIRAHVEEAWANTDDRTPAALRNILEQLGDPVELAREERERLGLITSQPQQTDYLAIAAVVFTVLFWPVGILLAWLSPSWIARDKAIATAIPVVGLLVLLILQFAAFFAFQAGPVVTNVQGTDAIEVSNALASSQGTFLRIAAIVTAAFGIVGAPLVSAAFLAWRLKKGRKAVLVPVIAAGLLGAILITSVAAASLMYSTTGVVTTEKPADVEVEIVQQEQE